MKTEELEEERKKLVESLGVHLERDKYLPPLAARILAILIIQHDHGITFERLVAELDASKSTICNHLNNLISQKRVSYFTKTGDRKRYYTMAPGYIVRQIESIIYVWNKELELREKVKKYKQEYNLIHSDDPYEIDTQTRVVDFLQQSVAYFRGELEKYRKIQNKLIN